MKYFIDLSDKKCPECGSTDLKVSGMNRDVIEVQCQECYQVFEEGELAVRKEAE